MIRSSISLALLCPLLTLACDPEDTNPGQAEGQIEVSPRDGQVNPCASLTPGAIQHSIDLIDNSIALTEAYLAESGSNDDGPGLNALNALNAAKGFIVAYQTYVVELGLHSPYISNQSVAGGASNEWGRASNSLTFAMQWSYLAYAADHSETVWMANSDASDARTQLVTLSNTAVQCCFFWSVFPCGNGFWQGVEECDDGNTINGDGCSSTCLIES
jgi:cysteine-rich repeat protein